MKYLILCILLTACGFNQYEPKLASIPRDHQKYLSDLEACKNEANSPHYGESVAIGAFGIIGLAAVGATDNDAFKSKPELTDRCMKAKRYDVTGS
jgi:hypothetical protein